MHASKWCYTFLCIWLTYLKTVIRPRAKLHLTALIVEREPRDVDLACRLENTGRYVQATAVIPHHHVRRVRSVESLVGTEVGCRWKKRRESVRGV